MTVLPPEHEQVPTLGYLGRPGQRVTATGIVTTALWVNGFKSSPSRLLILDCGTAVVKAFSTANWATTVEAGDGLTITGTVKKHELWRGTPQTVLTRARLHNPTQPSLQPVWEIVRDAGPRRRFPDTPITHAPPLAPRIAP